MPPIPGLAEARPWGNREATTATEAPESLVILGGGVVGVELAQAWSSLGTEVVLLEGAPRVIVREEPFASAEVAAALVEAGVEVRTESRAVAVSREGDEVVVELADGSSARGAELLVAVGRQVNTSEIGLETVGLEPGKPVEVGSNLRSPRHDWLYAIGDANGRALLTHMGKYQGRLAADAILGKSVTVRSDGPLSPRVIFTDPQVAAVGHTLGSAEAAGMVVRAVDAPTSGTAGASFVGRNTPGTSRLVLDDANGVIAGATFVGFEVGEMLHAATIAVIGEIPLDRLAHAVPCFPTRSELWLKLLEAAGL
jgi:dihydrolipoamide dehydrogenase